ncbi:MAG TPA: hypothetical protein VLK84_26450 [Longimicrobium sp.]|nr:hypothetical protein [Longimicrobium sp.]
MRSITDDHGRPWEAVAIATKVAHLRDGAQLGFRLAGDPAADVMAPITFNSMDAAEFAIRTMSEKELRRRLELAKTAAGVA